MVKIGRGIDSRCSTGEEEGLRESNVIDNEEL